MGVRGGIGWTGIVTMAVAAGLLVYPSVWARRIARDPRIRRNRDPLYVIVATAGLVVLILPASFLDMGWLSVPSLILMLSISHGVVHTEVSRRFTRDRVPEPVGVFASFAVPMVLLAAVTLVVSLQQLGAATAAGESGIAAVSSSVLLSFAVLGVGPPLVASIWTCVDFVRQRRAVRPRRDRPLLG